MGFRFHAWNRSKAGLQGVVGAQGGVDKGDGVADGQHGTVWTVGSMESVELCVAIVGVTRVYVTRRLRE